MEQADTIIFCLHRFQYALHTKSHQCALLNKQIRWHNKKKLKLMIAKKMEQLDHNSVIPILIYSSKRCTRYLNEITIVLNLSSVQHQELGLLKVKLFG
jgi:hypothetical protein